MCEYHHCYQGKLDNRCCAYYMEPWLAHICAVIFTFSEHCVTLLLSHLPHNVVANHVWESVCTGEHYERTHDSYCTPCDRWTSCIAPHHVCWFICALCPGSGWVSHSAGGSVLRHKQNYFTPSKLPQDKNAS